MSVEKVLRSCHVQPLDGESAFDSLKRHAKEQGWSQKLLKRWTAALRNAMMAHAESAFNSLQRLNEWLIGFSYPAESSVKKARAILRTIHINIFDLLENRFDKRHDSLRALQHYTRKHGRYYPLSKAKNDGLREFLRPMSHK